MTFKVTITSSNGQQNSYDCGGSTDQEALIYAGKVVERNADAADPQASVVVTKDGGKIGPIATVADMIKKAI